jgi:AcrR family transcriptional regulator
MTRIDARRSRVLLLRAGAQAFAADGFDVPVSVITERAGLAKGTFFRHFPTKRALLVALMLEFLDELRQLAGRHAASPGPDAIATFLFEAAERMIPLRTVIENAVLCRLEEGALQQALGVTLGALEPLLAHAQQRDEIRGDVTALDVYLVLMSTTGTSYTPVISSTHPDLWRRYLALGIDGLRPGSDRGELPPGTAWPSGADPG